jgi:plastocyanin
MDLLSAPGLLAIPFFIGSMSDVETGSIEGRIAHPLVARQPAAVYVEKVAERNFPPPAEHPAIDQRNLVFVPHVLPVLKGTTVDFKNSDTVKHNIFSSRKSPTVFNLGTYSAGVVRSVTFDKAGVVTLLCNVHAEMSAYAVVVETPFFAVTDRQGNFTIAGVPPGSYQLSFWHEALASDPQSVTVEKGKVSRIEWLKPKRK